MTHVQDRRLKLRIGSHQLRNRTVIIPVGEIDLSTRDELRDCIAACDGDVVVDLSGVTFLDSSGIGVLVGQRNRLVAAHGSMVFCDPRDNVRLVLETVGLGDLVD
jgi:anti-sigma B factor antagonist